MTPEQKGRWFYGIENISIKDQCILYNAYLDSIKEDIREKKQDYR